MANIPPNGNHPGFFKSVANAGQKSIKVGSFLVSNTDGFNKVSKVAISIIGFLSTILGQFVPGTERALSFLSKLNIGPEAAVTVTNATGVIDRVNDFTDPKKFKDINKTPQKLMSRVFLTPAQAFDSAGVLHKLEIIDIGALNSSIIGKLSIITLVKNVLVTISSIFTIWDCAKTIQAEKTSQVRQGERENALINLKRWQEITDGDVKQHIQNNEDKYDADADVGGVKAYKIEKYTNTVENTYFPTKKAWVSIAADIAKLAIIAISSIALMFVISSPVSLVVIGATSLAAATLGLVKTVYSEFGKRDIPENQFRKVS